MSKDLPPFLLDVIERYPDVWEAYQSLGQSVARSGGLDARTRRLVKLAIAVGASRRGSVRSACRRCRKAGISDEDQLQVALLAITTIGWSSAMKAFAWMDETASGSEDPAEHPDR